MTGKRDFDDFWSMLINRLSSVTRIRNWTAKKGYFGEDFTTIYISEPGGKEGGYMEIDAPSAMQIQKVRKHSFNKIYPNWEGYTDGRIERSFFVSKRKNPNATRHSKYIISILHQFEDLIYE